jgi:hypothetical protein
MAKLPKELVPRNYDKLESDSTLGTITDTWTNDFLSLGRGKEGVLGDLLRDKTVP